MKRNEIAHLVSTQVINALGIVNTIVGFSCVRRRSLSNRSLVPKATLTLGREYYTFVQV